MPILASTEALPLVTRQVIARFEEIAPKIGFLRQFFPDGELSTSKEVQWSVRRIKEEVATSVARGDIGNRNELQKGTDKWVLPPLYRERLDITDMKLYDRIHGSAMIDSGYVRSYLNKVESDMRELVNKIERAYEIQCAQFLNDGKVVDATYGDYDFGRKASSKVDGGSGTYWNTDSINPFTQIEEGCTWLRVNGLCDGNRFLMLCGESVLGTLDVNAIYKEQIGRMSNQINMLTRPTRNPGGATHRGMLSCGDYEVEIWTYPQYYKPASGAKRQFLEPKKISIIPENPEWMLSYGLVPQLVDEQNPNAQVGKYLYGEYKDGRKVIHEYDVQSCGLVIPVAVDRVWTRRVVA